MKTILKIENAIKKLEEDLEKNITLNANYKKDLESAKVEVFGGIFNEKNGIK